MHEGNLYRIYEIGRGIAGTTIKAERPAIPYGYQFEFMVERFVDISPGDYLDIVMVKGSKFAIDHINLIHHEDHICRNCGHPSQGVIN